MAKDLGINLNRIMNDKLSGIETTSIFSLSSLLDPRFKTLGFQSPSNAESAVHRLKSECAALLQNAPTQEDPPSTSTAQPEPAASSQVIDPWKLLDRDAEEARASRNATADAIVEVQRYLSAPPLERSQDPLVYWTTNKALYPNLYHLANQYLATPASSVPCERVFSKAGEIVSKREKPPQTLDCEKLLFLNKNA
ncbi:zinc finger BED domain-containing protein 4-like [Takifugu flavidus]|uniref:zinc finger BED domain-containing protein 4-like n=1 Tax=Takifugu flavidus TaxID=433684 RepID=UPI0025447458|nr:zinc finger BED domain-containing protein 4-like [Takifugu flavidus]